MIFLAEQLPKWEATLNLLLRRRSDSMPKRINHESKNIGYHRCEKKKLRKLRATPCSLQVFPSEPYHQAADGE